MPSKISKQQARRLLLQKQMLVGKKLKGKAGIRRIFETLRVIQYDPLNPCGRNADLVLQARVDDYHPDGYYDWLYKGRNGIECYDKELCIIPVEDYPLTPFKRQVWHESPKITKFVNEHQADVEQLLTFIKKNGPTSSSDVEKQSEVHDMSWFGTRWGRVALEILWKRGLVVISKREKGKKFYDLPEKVYGKRFKSESKTLSEEHVLRRMKAVGIAPLTRTGSNSGWQGVGDAKLVAKIINRLIEEGTLTVVEVEDVKTKYVIMSDDVKLLNKSFRFDDQMRFLAPLDTVMWDRRMVEDFFDFHYRWEVYVPAPKREYGYYVLPILYQDQLVGRIEPVLTKDKILEIRNFWQEPEVVWNDDMKSSLQEAISSFADYLHAEKIEKLENVQY